MKDHILKDIVALFQVHPVKTIAQAFAGELEAALYRRESSLKMLPSYLSRPTGEEKGDYIAIDFGGSNVRVMAVSLCGNGRSTITKQLSRPLVSMSRATIEPPLPAPAGICLLSWPKWWKRCWPKGTAINWA